MALSLSLGFATTQASLGQFAVVDDMEGGDNWTGNGSIVPDPGDPSNNVYAIDNAGNANDSEGYLSLGAGIADGDTGTLFYRIRSSASGAAGAELVDWVAGASDVAAPDNNWGNYEGYIRLSEDGTPGDIDIDVRNGGGFNEVGSAATDTWYNVWLVLDNNGDLTDAYYNSVPGADATDPSTLSLTGNAFRNGTSDALVTLYVRNNEGATTGYIDDVFLDPTAENLANPVDPSGPTDTDGDGLPDSYENQIINFDPNDDVTDLTHVLGPNNAPSTSDFDFDNLSDADEFVEGTNPTIDDTDGDDLLDGDEVAGTSNTFDGARTDPLKADTDADSVDDYNENGDLNDAFSFAATNPNAADTDGDGMRDDYELANNAIGTALDPNDNGASDATQAPGADRDGDTLTNLDEFNGAGDRPQTRADLEDTDDDTISDLAETNTGIWIGSSDTGTDPTMDDSDGDSILDDLEDPDLAFQGQGIYPNNSDPNSTDTDGDGYDDLFEIENGYDPGNIDDPVAPLGFTLVEDFEGTGMTIGQTFDGVNGWVTSKPAGISVADEPIAGGDQVGCMERLAAPDDQSYVVYKDLESQLLGIDEGAVGTMFLQIYGSTNTLNASFGLSDVAAPADGAFGAFEAQTILFNNIAIQVRDGLPAPSIPRDTGSTYAAQTWMNVWIVANNDTDTVKVYFESPNGESGQIEVTGDDGGDPFDFRNGTTNALSTVLFIVASGQAVGGITYIDNIYVDASAENLNIPAGVTAKPEPATDLLVTNLSFDANGDLQITFTPGGTGYELDSSPNLQNFAADPNASYDNIDTFTIPAISVPPGQWYYRVRKLP